ncbi:MAG: hypothetical protein HZC42_11925 [Candidatus Eisenbacteria bacterium]|nr:hypothetical protein [Candidatus Eisenbacteria bacterium]
MDDVVSNAITPQGWEPLQFPTKDRTPSPVTGFVTLLGGDYTYTMAARMQTGGLIVAVVGLALSLIGVIRGPRNP